MSNDSINERQRHQPWSVPYSPGVMNAERWVPHILASHCALHVAKTAGKLAGVFEGLDHRSSGPTDAQRQTIRDMAADLLTEALRFANLYGFSLADEHARRVTEKNPPPETGTP
jgi:hypothetical protein